MHSVRNNFSIDFTSVHGACFDRCPNYIYEESFSVRHILVLILYTLYTLQERGEGGYIRGLGLVAARVLGELK